MSNDVSSEGMEHAIEALSAKKSEYYKKRVIAESAYSARKALLSVAPLSDEKMPTNPEGEKAEIVMTEESIKNRLTPEEYHRLRKTGEGRVLLNSTIGNWNG